MGTYSIGDLARISNTKAHTIRIWEQRYGLLTPDRFSTNVRYYDDEQLRKLLTICTLLRGGSKISRISRLTKPELSEELGRMMSGAVSEDVRIEAFINQSLHAVAAFDAESFMNTFDDILGSFGWIEGYRKVVYPLLVRTGFLWIREDLLPSQEHFFSNLLRQKLFSAIDQLPVVKSNQKWILFLNEEEDHEIGLLFSCLVIRQRGHEAIYLGARVPYSDLAVIAAASAPSHIYTFFVGNRADNYINQLLTQLHADFPDIKVMYSGAADATHSLISPFATHVTDIDHLIQILNTHEQ